MFVAVIILLVSKLLYIYRTTVVCSHHRVHSQVEISSDQFWGRGRWAGPGRREKEKGKEKVKTQTVISHNHCFQHHMNLFL